MTCPDPETLAAAAEQRLDARRRDTILDHAAGCDDCRHVLLILGGLKTAAIPARTSVPSWIPWAAAAAVFILSVAAVLFMGRSDPEAPTAHSTPAPRSVDAPKVKSPVEAPTPAPAPKPVAPVPEPKSAPPVPVLPPVPAPPAPPAPETPAPAPIPEPEKPAPKPVAPATITVVAVLDRIDGDVFVVNGAARTPAKAGQDLRSGEGLECRGARSWAIASFPDKTRLELEGNTLVRELGAREPGRGQRLFLEKGAVKAEVAKQPAGQAMMFETPHGDAKVLGTVLRVHTDADPKKGTRLEVEEGRVELKNAAGKSVLVEAGHSAVSAAGMPMASKRLPKEEILLAFDLADGRKPAAVSRATVELGPGRRPCLAAETDAGGTSRLFVGDDDGLFTFAGDETLSFDYWVDPQASSFILGLWNRTQKFSHEGAIPKLTTGKWTHVTLKLAELGEPGTRLKEGDWGVNLFLQAAGAPPRKLYIDNLTLTRTRTFKPRVPETK